MLNRYVLMMLTATLCLSGCKVFLALEKPIARVQSVTLDEQTEHGSRVLVTVELANPNDVALPLVDAQYTLLLAPGSRVVSFRDAPNRTLPSKGRQVITLPAALPVSGGGNLRGASYRVAGSINYEPPGEIRELLTEAGIPLPSSEFFGSGTLD